MENSIPALFLAAILTLATVLIARGGYMGIDAVGQSLRTSEARYGDQNRTELSITSATMDITRTNLTIVLRNDGQTRLADFSRMDVMVKYTGETGTMYDKYIAYTSGALSSDRWTTGTFTNDSFEPGILNTGESVEILVRLNPAAGLATTNLAVIGTDLGITVQTTFQGL